MIHCQNCTTRNPLNREFCWKCGAKLLVASGPAASDVGIPMMEEHVLERISALEYSLGMVNKRVDSLIDTIERVAASNFIDHTMIETLTDALQQAGIDLSQLEEEWRKRIDSRILETQEVDRLGGRVDRILDAYRGPDRNQFSQWIDKSHDLFLAGQPKESIRFLKLALEHDSANAELGLLLAEVYFHTKAYGNAMRCLNHVLATRPDHFEATFLAGLIQQSKGELRNAQLQFERAVGLKKDSSAAHATLGSLLANVGNKKQALKHLSTALRLKPSASVHYLLGALYYNSGQHKRAIQHLKQATELDPQYGEAFYQLGLLCLKMNWLRKAQQCFKMAQTLNPHEKRYRKRVPSFSADATGPDQLSRLIREEIRLVQYGDSSGLKRK
jgi:tetratricopeptide (TPR) repeat protein